MATRSRMFNRRRALRGTLVIIVCLVLVSCGPAATPQPAAPTTAPVAPAATKAPAAFNWKQFEGKPLQVILNDHPQSRALEKRVSEFEALTGIKLTLEVLASSEYYPKSQLMLSTTPDKVDAYVMVPPQQMFKFVKEGFLEDLNPFIKDPTMTSPDFDLNDWIPNTFKPITVKGQLVGIPYFLHTDFLYYRKDLYKQKGLKCPETMQELEKNIIALHDPANQVYGWATRGIGAQAVPYAGMFTWGNGGSWLDEKDEPAINTPEAIASFKLFGDWLRKYGPPGQLDLEDGRLVNLFKEGKLAHLLLNVFQAATMNDPASSKVTGNVGACLWPKGTKGAFYNNIVVTLSINPKSKNKPQAWYFIQWATNKQMLAYMQGTPSIASITGRQSAWNSPEFMGGSAKVMPDWYEVAKTAVASPGIVSYPPAEDVAAARDIVGKVITAAIKDEDVTAAANEAQAKYKKLLEGAK